MNTSFTWWSLHYTFKQYLGKAENVFNIRPNNHRENVKNPNAIPACSYFQGHSHKFNNQAKFLVWLKLVNNFSLKDILRARLIRKENFWIEKTNPSSIRNEPRTQQIKIEDLRTAFSCSFEKDIYIIYLTFTNIYIIYVILFCTCIRFLDVAFKLHFAPQNLFWEWMIL